MGRARGSDGARADHLTSAHAGAVTVSQRDHADTVGVFAGGRFLDGGNQPQYFLTRRQVGGEAEDDLWSPSLTTPFAAPIGFQIGTGEVLADRQ